MARCAKLVDEYRRMGIGIEAGYAADSDLAAARESLGSGNYSEALGHFERAGDYVTSMGKEMIADLRQRFSQGTLKVCDA
jgi:hypothetical protein